MLVSFTKLTFSFPYEEVDYEGKDFKDHPFYIEDIRIRFNFYDDISILKYIDEINNTECFVNVKNNKFFGEIKHNDENSDLVKIYDVNTKELKYLISSNVSCKCREVRSADIFKTKASLYDTDGNYLYNIFDEEGMKLYQFLFYYNGYIIYANSEIVKTKNTEYEWDEKGYYVDGEYYEYYSEENRNLVQNQYNVNRYIKAYDIKNKNHVVLYDMKNNYIITSELFSNIKDFDIKIDEIKKETKEDLNNNSINKKKDNEYIINGKSYFVELVDESKAIIDNTNDLSKIKYNVYNDKGKIVLSDISICKKDSYVRYYFDNHDDEAEYEKRVSKVEELDFKYYDVYDNEEKISNQMSYIINYGAINGYYYRKNKKNKYDYLDFGGKIIIEDIDDYVLDTIDGNAIFYKGDKWIISNNKGKYMYVTDKIPLYNIPIFLNLENGNVFALDKEETSFKTNKFVEIANTKYYIYDYFKKYKIYKNTELLLDNVRDYYFINTRYHSDNEDFKMMEYFCIATDFYEGIIDDNGKWIAKRKRVVDEK